MMFEDNKDRFELYQHSIASYVARPVSQDQFIGFVKKLADYWNLCELPG